MSKLTLEEAISHCLEVAEEHTKYNSFGGFESCDECAKEHRQLAEWLQELKEAKRLLKEAVEDINAAEACDTCEYYSVINGAECQKDDCYKWRYADEALKLIGGEEQ